MWGCWLRITQSVFREDHRHCGRNSIFGVTSQLPTNSASLNKSEYRKSLPQRRPFRHFSDYKLFVSLLTAKVPTPLPLSAEKTLAPKRYRSFRTGDERDRHFNRACR